MKKKLIYFIGCMLISPFFLTAQQANVNLDYNPQKNTEGLTPFSAPVNSPEVHDDHTVTFRLRAPNAQKVVLPTGAIYTANGLGNEPIPFVKGDDGIWTLTIGPLKPDMYAYHFNIDGVQVPDQAIPMRHLPPCLHTANWLYTAMSLLITMPKTCPMAMLPDMFTGRMLQMENANFICTLLRAIILKRNTPFCILWVAVESFLQTGFTMAG